MTDLADRSEQIERLELADLPADAPAKDNGLTRSAAATVDVAPCALAPISVP